MLTNVPGSTARTNFTVGSGDPNENGVPGNPGDKFFDRSSNVLYLCIQANVWQFVTGAIDVVPFGSE